MRIECGQRAGAGDLMPDQADYRVERGLRYRADTQSKNSSSVNL